MTARPARFTEADLTRALKVAREAGMTVEVLRDGTIRIVPLTGQAQPVDAGREFSL